ncbi:helix-turn-helix domain-containing protein [Amorphus sp. 3PC139-8]|uniref:helix-turn-helix domain-containing protein n=1 Tax=Amorphus sp. 3PC139-8 TaxID=2735676 RepID=UPI00345D87FC
MIESTVAAAFALPIDELAAPTRRRAEVAFARQVAMYIAHVDLGLSLTETGGLFERDRTTAAHACRVVEDRRDDGDLDRLLDAIEAVVVAWKLTLECCRRRAVPGRTH